MALLLGDPEDVLGVLRPVGIKPFAIQEFQSFKHSRGLLRAVLSCDGSQCILRGLNPVLPGDEDREERIFGSLVLKLRSKTNSGDDVHQITEVDPFMRADAREFADGLALGPLGQGFGSHLVLQLRPWMNYTRV